MTYSLDQAVAWAKLPVRVRHDIVLDEWWGHREEIEVWTIDESCHQFDAISATKSYISIRNQLAAYLPPEPKPGQNVDVVA